MIQDLDLPLFWKGEKMIDRKIYDLNTARGRYEAMMRHRD